jgi:hypothetical protein
MTAAHINTFTAVTETAEAMRTRADVSFANSLGLGPATALARRCQR